METGTHVCNSVLRSVIDLQLRGYNGRSGAQCSPDHLGVLAKLCPRLEQLHLGLTWPESFLFLSRFRNISHLSVFRVASVENFDLPLMVLLHLPPELSTNLREVSQCPTGTFSSLKVLVFSQLRFY